MGSECKKVSLCTVGDNQYRGKSSLSYVRNVQYSRRHLLVQWTIRSAGEEVSLSTDWDAQHHEVASLSTVRAVQYHRSHLMYRGG